MRNWYETPTRPYRITQGSVVKGYTHMFVRMLPLFHCCRWNPVQGGSWQHQLPRIVQHHVNKSSGAVHVAVNPRNWAGQELLEDVHMVTHLTLWEHGAKVSE